METLPPEMVEMVAQYMTALDIARCSAVSRRWYEMFNQNGIWKLLCDPELVEPLQTTPRVVTSAFVPPKEENSSLSPICWWKLAFIREKQLWKNWSWKNVESHKKDELSTKPMDANWKCVDFLTDTAIVCWDPRCIEIMDVSMIPAALVARLRFTVNKGQFKMRVFSPSMLLIENLFSIEVFNVDLMNKSIELKYELPIYNERPCLDSIGSNVIGSTYLRWCIKGSKLIICDLETGTKIKEVTIPEKHTKPISDVVSSPTSSFVDVVCKNSNEKVAYHQIYDLKRLIFLPGPAMQVEVQVVNDDIVIHGNHLAFGSFRDVTIYNFETRKVQLRRQRMPVNCAYYKNTHVFHDSFIFFTNNEKQIWLQMYSVAEQSLTTICTFETNNLLVAEVINSKFIVVRDKVWEKSGKTVKRRDMHIATLQYDAKINRSFTKVVENYANESPRIEGRPNDGRYRFNINKTWTVSHFW